MYKRQHLWYHNAIEPIKIESVIIIIQKLVRNNKEEKNATIFDSIVSNTGDVYKRQGKFFMEPAGFTGLRHLAFENGIEYWYQ